MSENKTPVIGHVTPLAGSGERMEAEAERDAMADRMLAREMERREAESNAKAEEDLGARGIREYGERSREERAEAARFWSSLTDEDRERVAANGVAIVMPDASGSMRHNVQTLAIEWAKQRYGEPVTAADGLPMPLTFSAFVSEMHEVIREARQTGAVDARGRDLVLYYGDMMRRLEDAVDLVNPRLALRVPQDETGGAADRRGAAPDLPEGPDGESYDQEIARLERQVEALTADIAGARARRDALTARLCAIATRLGANLPPPADRDPEDAALRIELGVADLKRAHAKAERSRARWEARAKRAEVKPAKRKPRAKGER